MANERFGGKSPFYPEQHGRPPPERGGSRFHAIVTRPPDRGRTPAPTLPREAPLPTRQDQRISKELEEVLKQPRKTRKNRMLKTALGLSAVGVVGVGAYEVYENVPAVHRAVDSAFLDHLKGSSEASTIDLKEVFDSKARSGEIGTIKRISEEETAGLNPFAKIGDHNTVLAIFPIDVSTSNKPDAKIKFKKANNSSGNDQDRLNRAEGGYLNIFDFENVPAGSTILAPVDGTLTLFYSYPKKLRDLYPNLIDEVHNISTAAINFQSGDGKKFRLIIGGGPSGGGMIPKPEHFIGLKSLTDAPIIKGEMSPSEVLEITKQRSIPVKKGQPILQLPDREFKISFAIRSEDSDPSKEKEEIINGEKMLIVQEYPTNAELFLSEDGAIVQPQLPK